MECQCEEAIQGNSNTMKQELSYEEAIMQRKKNGSNAIMKKRCGAVQML
jgi:hypothetical protein